MLTSTIYTLKPALHVNQWFETDELVDVKCPKRAKHLQNEGAAIVVGDAPIHAAYLQQLRIQKFDINTADEKTRNHISDLLMFLNRVKLYPLELRDAEWEALCGSFTAPMEWDDDWDVAIERHYHERNEPQPESEPEPEPQPEPVKPKRTRKKRGDA